MREGWHFEGPTSEGSEHWLDHVTSLPHSTPTLGYSCQPLCPFLLLPVCPYCRAPSPGRPSYTCWLGMCFQRVRDAYPSLLHDTVKAHISVWQHLMRSCSWIHLSRSAQRTDSLGWETTLQNLEVCEWQSTGVFFWLFVLADQRNQSSFFLSYSIA